MKIINYFIVIFCSIILTFQNANSFSSEFQISGTVSEVNIDKNKITLNVKVADVEIINGKKTETISNSLYTLNAEKEILSDIKIGDNVVCNVEPKDKCTKIKKIQSK